MPNNIPNTYEYLVVGDNPPYTEKEIWDRYIFWSEVIKDIVKQNGLENKAIINERKLIYMVLSYFADIVRLKEFHPVERTNRIKVFAYSFFWLLRMAPVQLLEEVDDKDLFINEMIAVDVFYTQFVHEVVQASGLDDDLIHRYLQEILYYFKYRRFDQQSIENQILSFVVGAGINPFEPERTLLRHFALEP
jgi:hypothetical protein